MAETLATPGRRVKVYVLNGAGKWDDRGTGHVRVETDPDTKAVVLKVTSDETGRVSLTSTIRATHEAFYQMQEDNIISWNEELLAGVPTEVALSFQEPEGCRELWDKIRHVDAAFKRTAAQRAPAGNSRAQSGINAQSACSQGTPTDGPATDPLTPDANVPSTAAENLHHHTNPADGVPLVDPTAPDTAHSRFFEDNLEGAAWGNADAIDDVVFPDNANVLFLGNSPASFVPNSSADTGHPTTFVMPEPDRAGVEALARIMSDQAMLSLRPIREEIIGEVLTSDYITRLCQVFRKAEREGDLECLAMLYHIIRCLFVIGNNGVLEILVSEKHLMDVVGCLEYDQEHMPELERRKADAKRKEDKKNPNSATSSESPSQAPKACCSSEQADQENRQHGEDRLSEEKKEGSQTQEKSRICENPAAAGVTAASEQKLVIEIESSKNSPKAKERHTRPEGAAEEKASAAQTTPPSNLTESKATSKQVNQSIAEKNNSEETSSSGNFPGEAPRFSLRTHRDYLERKVSYRSVVPINDQNVIAKIHQNYRVAYIRDVILSRVFDDGMSNMLSAVILCNNVDIIMYFISGSNALQELFTRLKATVQNHRRVQESTATSGPSQYALSKQNETELSKRIREKGVPAAAEVVSTDDSSKSLADIQSGEVEGVSPDPGSKQESNSSNGVRAGPKSNAISLTTSDSCPTTDPNVVISADQSSRDDLGREKRLFDSATRDPKSSEQSEEHYEDLRNMLGLLRELCQVVKGQQPAVQARFHQMLLELGALEISVSLLLDKDPVLRSLCCDILSTVIYHDQGDVRAHIMKNATQQHSSVPKQLIGSRKTVPGAKLMEETAIMTQAGASGVTAEVAIGQQHWRADEKRSAALSGGPDAAMSKAVDPSAIPRDGSASAGDEKASTATGSHEAESHAPLESKEDSLSVSLGKSQDSASNGPEDGDAANCAISLVKNPRSMPISKETNATTHPMLSASLGEPEPRIVGDEQNDAFLSSFGTSAQNQSRIETDFPLLSAMVEVICQDKESGVALTVLDLLRTLLDPMNMKPSPEKNVFLNVFYEKFVFRLMAPIEVASHPERQTGANEKVSDENVCHICDLMSYCVSQHAFRSKYFVLGNNVGGKIVELIRHKKAHVRLSSIRFVRTCVGMRDDMYDRYVVEKRLLDPIMELYSKNQHKDNLTSSSVLDLVSFLASQKREVVLRHIITEYSTTLQPSTKKCIVFEDAKRILDVIEKEKTFGVEGKHQKKESGQEGGSQPRRGEAANAEQRVLLGKTDTDEIPHGRGSVFLSQLSQLDHGEISNQMMINATFRDGPVPGNMRFGTSFHGHDMRMFSDEDAFFTRLTGTSDVVHKLSGTDQEAVEQQLKPGGGGPGIASSRRSPEQGGMRQSEARGLVTTRKMLSKTPPFKTGLRSVSPSGVPKRSHMGANGALPTGLRSQAVPLGGFMNAKSPNTSDTKQRSLEKGVTLIKGKPAAAQSSDKDVIMMDESPEINQPESDAPNHDGANERRNEKAIRLSLSKSQAKNGELPRLREREGEVLLSESSGDHHSPRKRERVESEKSIETCTRSVLGRLNNEDSPTKRRRVEDATSGEDECRKSDGDLKDNSEDPECDLKNIDRTKTTEDTQKADCSKMTRNNDGQGDREKRR